MKLTDRQMEKFEQAFRQVLSSFPTLPAIYASGCFPGADKTKNLQKRFLFEMCLAAELMPYIIQLYGEGFNDRHIYAALRKVAKNFNVDWVK